MKRVADIIADFLTENSITDIFTVTGGGAMHLNDAFGKHPGLRCIYNHHEQASAIAAESYARLTNRIAAVCVTTGPGGTNAITGVLGGWLDSIPMLVISGQVRYDTTVQSTGMSLRQLGDQEFDIVSAVISMTKYAVMVTDPCDILYQLGKALHMATSERPGPVWLDIPLNVQSALVDEERLTRYTPSYTKPAFSDDLIRELLVKIKNAKRPILMAGTGVRLSGGFDAFLNLTEKLGIPVVTAFNAHDLLWNDHPLYVGRPGTVGERAGNFAVQNSDLLLVIGCRLNIRQISYNWNAFASRAYKIMVDIDPLEMRKPTLSIDCPVLADAKDFMLRLADKIEQAPLWSGAKWLSWCLGLKERFSVVLDSYREKDSPVNPYCFMDSLFAELPPEQIIVASNATACVCSFQAAYIRRGQRLYSNSGSAPMGYGLPAAIGACVGASRRSVICLEGDGSLQMNVQELQTVSHNRLPIKIFVMNNDGYHSIRQTQTSFFDEPLVGVGPGSGLTFPRLDKLAEAYSIPYARIGAHNGMVETLRGILSSDGPSLCEVILDKTIFFAPKLASKKLPDGRMESPPLEDMWPFLTEAEVQSVMEGLL